MITIYPFIAVRNTVLLERSNRGQIGRIYRTHEREERRGEERRGG
jgi:hypothetical protein